MGVRVACALAKLKYAAVCVKPAGLPTYKGALSTISPSLCVRLRNCPPDRTSRALLPRRNSRTFCPLGSGVNVDSDMPSAVVAEIPPGARAGVQRNGVPDAETGSQVAIRRPVSQSCASSFALARHSAEVGAVSTCAVAGFIG